MLFGNLITILRVHICALFSKLLMFYSFQFAGNDNTNDKIDGSRRPKNLQTADDTALQRRQKSSTANWNEVADKERATTIADTTTATTIATTTESTIATNTISSPKSQFIKLNMVIYYVRQFFCLLIVIVTTYATYQNM